MISCRTPFRVYSILASTCFCAAKQAPRPFNLRLQRACMFAVFFFFFLLVFPCAVRFTCRLFLLAAWNVVCLFIPFGAHPPLPSFLVDLLSQGFGGIFS